VHELGIPEQGFFLRPLTKRGFSQKGIELRAEDVSPELTVTADGVFWHPQSAGEAMLLSRDIFPLRDAVQLMQTNLEVMAAGGPLPQRYRYRDGGSVDERIAHGRFAAPARNWSHADAFLRVGFGLLFLPTALPRRRGGTAFIRLGFSSIMTARRDPRSTRRPICRHLQGLHRQRRS
jgi:hypothetical protein